eukprot:scaffold109957_cov26-Tisochrysis_lutea.AAC.3
MDMIQMRKITHYYNFKCAPFASRILACCMIWNFMKINCSRWSTFDRATRPENSTLQASGGGTERKQC